MLFGLLVIPLVAMIGLAVDFGRVYSVTSHTQAALDAAALAAGRAAQLNSSNAVTAASAAATAYFNQAKPQDVVTSTLAVLAELRQHGIHGYGDLVGEDAIPERALLARSQGRCPGSPRWLPVQRLRLRHGDEHVDRRAVPERCLHGQRPRAAATSRSSLMLDVTGSMCQPCTKIQAVQSAAKDLIDIVVWADQSQVLLQGGAGAVRRGRQRRRDAGAAGARNRHGRTLRIERSADFHHHVRAQRHDATSRPSSGSSSRGRASAAAAAAARARG